LDRIASFTQSEDHEMRFRAIGWNTVVIDGHNLEDIRDALSWAKQSKNGKPTIIIAKTVIGKGIAEIEGTTIAHGEGGLKFENTARRRLGLPNEKFYVAAQTRDFFTGRKLILDENYQQWQKKFSSWKNENPLLAKELDMVSRGNVTADYIMTHVPPYHPPSTGWATRQSAAFVLQAVAKLVPQFISGSADLYSSTKNYIEDGGDFGAGPTKSYTGRNYFFGIREHGMGAILNGIAQYGLHIPSGSTFLAFSDYMRPTIRIAALSQLHVNYIFTHDSIAVGEDGPTHQPIETLSSLRLIPNLDVIRPADLEEVVGAFAAAVSRKNGPTALILSRQAVPNLNHVSVNIRREGVLRGAYVIQKEQNDVLDGILIATGSEVTLAIQAAAKLGPSIRVVSMPCIELFERQNRQYKEKVLPSVCKKRIAIEAGVPDVWYKYVGIDGMVIGVDRFGASAPGEELMEHYGLTVDRIVSAFMSVAEKY
jgi:transketolase